MWEERWSKSRNRPFYFNLQTGESVWDKPEGLREGIKSNDKIHCLHILVKHAGSRRPSSFRSPHITRTEEEAVEALERLNIVDVEQFRTMARDMSDCSSAKQSGDLGWFGRGEMQPAFEQAAFSLSPGQMTKHPIKTDSGFHLIWRLE